MKVKMYVKVKKMSTKQRKGEREVYEGMGVWGYGGTRRMVEGGGVKDVVNSEV